MIPPQEKPTAGYLKSGLAINEAILNGYDDAIFLQKSEISVKELLGISLLYKGMQIPTYPAQMIFSWNHSDNVAKILNNELGLSIFEKVLQGSELYEAD